MDLGFWLVAHLDWYLSQSFSNHLKHFALQIRGNPSLLPGKTPCCNFFIPFSMQMPVPSGTVCNGFKVESA